jgi:hypothetical protein
VNRNGWGQAIGATLIQLSHEVKMSSCTADNEKATQWVKTSGMRASQGTFADAAFGKILCQTQPKRKAVSLTSKLSYWRRYCDENRCNLFIVPIVCSYVN